MLNIPTLLRDSDPQTLQIVANAAGTTVGYLRHVIAGRRGTSPQLNIRLQQALGVSPVVCPVCEGTVDQEQK